MAATSEKAAHAETAEPSVVDALASLLGFEEVAELENVRELADVFTRAREGGAAEAPHASLRPLDQKAVLCAGKSMQQ